MIKEVERAMKRILHFSLTGVLFACLLLTGCGTKTNEPASPAETSKSNETSAVSAESKTLRIGYQKGNTLHILKARGHLEQRLQEKGYQVEWTPFPTGSVLLEALTAGSLDFGHASDGNSVFAQAGGKPIVYVASESPYPKGVALLAAKDSAIHTVKDLKGKKVAVTKGGNQQYLLVKALQKEGLTYEDITPVYYKDASEGRIMFESGKIDVLGFWDPFYAVLENTGNTRVIVDGEGYTENRTYYFASQEFSKEHPDLIKIILEELQKSDEWANDHPGEVAKLLAPELNIDVASLELATKRRQYGVQKIDDHVIRVQQDLADTFHSLKLFPNRINIEDVIEKNPNWLPDPLK
jgi:sulfonate transport system substrate-binding protein